MKVKNYLLGTLVVGASLSANAASINGFDITGYGFLKASAMYADKGLASFNNINLSAHKKFTISEPLFDKMDVDQKALNRIRPLSSL